MTEQDGRSSIFAPRKAYEPMSDVEIGQALRWQRPLFDLPGEADVHRSENLCLRSFFVRWWRVRFAVERRRNPSIPWLEDTNCGAEDVQVEGVQAKPKPRKQGFRDLDFETVAIRGRPQWMPLEICWLSYC